MYIEGKGLIATKTKFFLKCPQSIFVHPVKYNTYIYIVIIILILLFRCIDFRGTHTNKAQYIRLAFDTRPELVLSLLLREWCLERPKLLITTTGGKANFELQSRIKRSLRRGLLKAAKTTGEKQICL